jgi:hypothetical protein
LPDGGDAVVALRTVNLPLVRLSFFVSRPAFSGSFSTKRPPKRIKSPDQNFVYFWVFDLFEKAEHPN